MDARRVWKRVTRSDFDALTDRELYAVMAIAAALLVLLAVLAFRTIEPPPPHALRISTGAASGAYDGYARRYAAALAKDGIALEVLPSQGSLQNLQRLADPASGVAATFVQSGSAGDSPPAGIQTLASVAYEPVWVFLRGGQAITRPARLAGLRIAIGAPGSGVRLVADAILGAAGVTSANAHLEEINPADSVPRLIDGQLDAAFVVAAFDAPIVQQALRAGLLPMDFEQADAYARRLPWLTRVTLPRGVIDLARGQPDHDVALLATTTDLLVRADLHPALAFLLMDVAMGVHGSPGVFNGIREFPSVKSLDFPQSEESKRYLANGRPFLQRYLPFWLANLVQRLSVSVLPLLLLLWPLLRAPANFFKWRAQSRIARIYDEIKEFEQAASAQREQALARLAGFEQRLEDIRVVSTHLVDYYNCKAHIDMLRARYGAAPPA